MNNLKVAEVAVSIAIKHFTLAFPAMDWTYFNPSPCLQAAEWKGNCWSFEPRQSHPKMPSFASLKGERQALLQFHLACSWNQQSQLQIEFSYNFRMLDSAAHIYKQVCYNFICVSQFVWVNCIICRYFKKK